MIAEPTDRRGRTRAAAIRSLEALRPRHAAGLDRFLRTVLDLRVPRRALVEGNDPPFDYLTRAFFEAPGPPETADAPHPAPQPPTSAGASTSTDGDLVVWANRGGGKTMLGAVATLLDLLFKPGVQVRILGGSREQSSRMFEHLRRFTSLPAIAPLLKSPATRQRIELINDSRAELSAQSQRSVRGVRVHKLRCDEIELFKPEIWRAAQLTTRSGRCGPIRVRGVIEALSTMHQPGGLMSQLVQRRGATVLRWSAIDVIERCPPDRPCDGCVLWNDCRGVAKAADGFFPVDDLVRQWHRTSDATWDAEMMCRRPSVEHVVYPGFDPTPGGRHVLAHDVQPAAQRAGLLVAGMDFGLRNPLVMLWARVHPPAGGAADPRLGVVEIIDEHHQRGLTLDDHLDRIEDRGWGRPTWIGVDPAGAARNGQTGVSDVQVLRRRGYRVRTRRLPVRLGLDCVRRRIDRGALRIAPRCTGLIHALSTYRYPARHESENPLKDGPDHACDALRYLLTNLDTSPAPVRTRIY